LENEPKYGGKTGAFAKNEPIFRPLVGSFAALGFESEPKMGGKTEWKTYSQAMCAIGPRKRTSGKSPADSRAGGIGAKSFGLRVRQSGYGAD